MLYFKKSFLIVIFFVFVYSLQAATDSTRVLFIGNSITYYNGMPQMFRDLANDKGEAVSIGTHTPGGSGIVDHYVSNVLYQIIRSEKWDIVIIQPGSSESAGVSFPVETTVKRANILLDSIYKYNECAKVFLYEIPYGIPTNGGYNQYFTVQTMFRDSVTKMADLLKLQILPAGECVRAYYSKYQNLLLHSNINDIHPNANGSFMIASSFYAGVFQDSTFGASYYSTINVDTAKRFFNLVDSIVLNNKPDWRINTYNIHAEFAVNQSNDTIQLSNNSSNYSNVLWDFGDGNNSSLDSPTHKYSALGNYQIKLKVIKQACFDTAFANVTIDVISGFNSPENESISCFPNPVVNNLNFETAESIDRISIFDINGKLLYSEYPKANVYKMNIGSLKAGIYIINIYSADYIYTRKIIKE